MTTNQATGGQFEMLDKKREVWFSDVIFDSNVIDVDPVADQRLLALTELLVATPRGNVWFSMTSLYEVLAPKDAAKRTELLRRFQSLYSRFGERVRFMKPEPFISVVAEWSNQGLPSAPASVIDNDVAASIAAGELVGLLKLLRDEWMVEKARLHDVHANSVKKLSATYEAEEWFRNLFKQNVALYGTTNALDQCDDIVKSLIVDHAKQPPESILKAKANHAEYPCTWTLALLMRLADYAATLTDTEWRSNFEKYGRLLKKNPNDYIDASIAASGGSCGMLITNDRGLVEKINFLHDVTPPLIRLQAFTVYDALIAFNPPNGAKRDRSKPIP